MRIRADRDERRRVRVPWPLVFALLLLGSFLVIAYMAASYAVYDTLSATTGECHPDDAANTPQQFSASGLDDADTAPYAMPAPQDVDVPLPRPAASPASRCAGGGSRAGRRPGRR